MSWYSKITGRDRAREALQKVQGMAAADPLSEQSLGARYASALDSTGKGGGWEDAFNKTAGATIQNALPDLRNGLQMTRENAIRRGVSTGDYGTSAEGDLTSAWQRNLSNALAGQAENAYENNQSRFLALLTGGMDRQTAAENARKKAKAGLWGGIGTVAGGIIGSAFPGVGTGVGATIGGSIGSGLGGY